MRSLDKPLVSVVTPVYNGQAFLHECIESVLAQTYQNFEYIVVNNCSTDNTLDIARAYADKDERVSVVTNDRFVGLIENHNRAFGLISSQSKYCKVVCADDWLYPECIVNLVELAERNPAVGIVGSYAISNKGVRWLGLEPDSTVLSGRDVCRRYLLGKVDSFATPSAILYRADLVRSRQPFFPGSAPNADLAGCLSCLQTSDFGFVHQILSFDRVHDKQVSNTLRDFNSFLLDRLEFVDKYGPIYLSQNELINRRKELLCEYHEYLAAAICSLRHEEFWSYHKRRLHQLGYSFIGMGLIKAISVKCADLVFNPGQTFQKVLKH